MENLIAVVESVQESIVEIESITVGFKAMSTTIPSVTMQVEEFTQTMRQFKRQTAETFTSLQDSLGNISMLSHTKTATIEHEAITLSVAKAVEDAMAPGKMLALPPHAEEKKSDDIEEAEWEEVKEEPKPKAEEPSPKPSEPNKQEENPMSIGQAIKGMPEALRNLHTEYDNVLKNATRFADIVKDGADKIFIQSGAAQVLMEKIPALGDVYRELEGPMHSVMDTVSNAGEIVGGFADKFHESTDFIAGMADGIKNAYSAAESGLQSFNSYINTVKEIDTMVRTLTDAQKWAAFFTNIYTAAQSALNVVMNLSPWTIVIGFILALIAGLRLAWEKSESFRQVLFGIWEVAKVVFKGLFEIGKVVFDAYIMMWKGIAEVILGALNAPFDGGEMFKKGMDDIANSTQMLTTIPDKMHKMGEDVGKAWEAGKAKGSASYQKSLEEKKQLELPGKPQSKTESTGGVVKTESITGSNVVPTSRTSGGTNNSRNVNVRIESLVKEINIFSNAKESAQDIRKLIQEELIAAVRDFESIPFHG